MSPFRRSSLAVFVVALALYAATTHRRVFTAGNDAARWATIESIVDHGTTSIEGSLFAGAVDQVRLDGRVYSNKPPLLAFAGAAIYAPLERLTGWSLGGAGAANVLHVVIVLLVGLPAAALVAAFQSAVREGRRASEAWTLVLAVALGAGTLLWPFATTLNAHVPAAASLFFSLLAARRGRALRAGAWCGLAAGFDLIPGAGFAPFFAWIAQREKSGKGGARFGAGFFGVALMAALANFVHHGSVLPLKMVGGAVDLSAKAGPSLFGVVLPERASYPLEVLFGWHGLFLVSPVLLFGAWGLWIAGRQASAERVVWRAVALGVAVQIAGHALLAGSYGGWSYGFRYLLPIHSFLLLGAPFALERQRAWVAPAFAGALAISVLFSGLGAFHPWPPAYEQDSSKHSVASAVRNPIGGNLAAFLMERAPDSAIAGWATRRFISPDPGVARAYLRLFFGSKSDFESMKRFEP